jgi:hypothetical protein
MVHCFTIFYILSQSLINSLLNKIANEKKILITGAAGFLSAFHATGIYTVGLFCNRNGQSYHWRFKI